MNQVLIKNAYLVDPSMQIEENADILIQDGLVVKVCDYISDRDFDGEVINAEGLIAAPGLIDMHVHFRDPGYTHKEDILSGCASAAAGGFTAVACMPNTNPVADTPQVIRYMIEKAVPTGVRVFPVAAISQGMRGEVLTDFALLKEAGAVAVSDDGRPVRNAALMQAAIERAEEYGLLVISHCEDLDIIGKGIMHKGSVSEALGVPGMDRSSEDSVTAREIALAAATGGRVHIAHVSTKGAVAFIRDAKRRGVRVTAETAPHYFMLTHALLASRDACYRMNPPLREEDDRRVIRRAVIDGTIDCIATDHAPHTAQEKAVFETAPNGVVGLETSLAVTLTKLYHDRHVSLTRVIELLSTRPARVLGIEGGTLREGARADIVLFDKEREWTVHPDELVSRSKNTVFKGMTLKGKVIRTISAGRTIYQG